MTKTPPPLRDVAALYVRADSIYKRLPAVDAWDIERDARHYVGPAPVVAHPPCRAWSRLRHFAKPRLDEKELAIIAIAQVRQFGGVLEHPSGSLLWRDANLPPPKCLDEFGGHTLPISQKWFGHKAEKRTWLYIVGLPPARLPPYPLALHQATHTAGKWSGRDRSRQRPELSKADRERTPPLFADWLVAIARLSERPPRPD